MPVTPNTHKLSLPAAELPPAELGQRPISAPRTSSLDPNAPPIAPNLTLVLRYGGLIAFCIFAWIFLDSPAARWVQAQKFSPHVDAAFQIIRAPGNFLFTIGVAFVLIWRDRCSPRLALMVPTAGVIASGITTLLKLCFGRLRPFHDDGTFGWMPFAYGPLHSVSARYLSFPSGDATLAFATAAAFAVIEPRLARYGYAWAILVGIVRVMQGAHYVSDVIAGAIVGLATAEVLLRVVRAARTMR